MDAGRTVLAHGWTSTVYKLDDCDKHKVVKVLDRKNAKGLFEVEREVYERISLQSTTPSSLLAYFGVDSQSEFGLILERAENGSFWNFLPKFSSMPLEERNRLLRRWARQSVEALSFVHQLGILHCDIHLSNFFLDKEMNLKLADFGAASIDKQQPLLMYRTTHQLWVKDGHAKWRRDYSVASEIFALGCALYNLDTFLDALDLGKNEQNREEVQRRLRERELPDTNELPALGAVIQRCWKLDYHCMNDLLADLEEPTPINL